MADPCKVYCKTCKRLIEACYEPPDGHAPDCNDAKGVKK